MAIGVRLMRFLGKTRVALAILLFVLTALSQAISYWGAGELLDESVRDREIDKITSIGNVVERLIAQHGERVALAARLLVAGSGGGILPDGDQGEFSGAPHGAPDGGPSGAPAGDRDADTLAEIARRVEEATRGAGLDILELTDDKEVIVYRADEPARRGGRATAWGVFEALGGRRQLVSTFDTLGVAIQAIEPVRVGDRIIGTLSTGVRLDDRFMRSLSREVRAEVVLLPRSGRPGNVNPALAGHLDSQAITEAFQEKIPVYRSLPDSHGTIVFFPILVIDQACVVAVHLDSSAAYRFLEQAGRRSAGYAVLVLAGTLLVGLMVLHTLLRPLDRLRRHAEAIAVDVTGEPIRAGNRDEVKAVVQVLEALTDRLVRRNQELIDAEKRMAEARWAAEAADRAKSEFLAIMSHELRTPLAGVLGMAQSLSLTHLTDAQKRMMAALRYSANLLLGMINDILDFRTIEGDKVVLEESDLELIDLVELGLQTVSAPAREKGLKLAAFLDPGLNGIYRGDFRKISQVLLNLLDNAVKFTDRGAVVVDVRSMEGGVIEFSVTDTGIGIELGQMHKVFERFSQIDGSRTRRTGGAGLGLAISRRLIELMGGRIAVESVFGRGSRFFFRLELPRMVPGVPLGPVLPSGAGVFVVVVEDQPLVRDATTRQLAAWGLAVEAVATWQEAVGALYVAASCGHVCAAALVTDDLGGEPGTAVARHLRAVPGFATLPVILLSCALTDTDAVSDADTGADAHPAGAAYHRFQRLAMPLRHDELAGLLTWTVGGGESPTANGRSG